MRTVWVAFAWLGMAMAAAGQQGATMPADAEQLLALTNQARAADGLGPLRWSPALAEAARGHAEIMVESGALSHQYPGEPDLAPRAAAAGAHFHAVAENIAVGPDVTNIQTQWMHSVGHRTNILDPQMNVMGIALLRRGGELYAVEDFANEVESLTPAQVEARVASLLKQQGIAPTGPAVDARQTCEMPHGTAGGSRPLFVMRWESSDVSRLPPALLDRIHSRGYKYAAVGTCGSSHPGQGFTTYRVAVLLY